MTEHSESAFYYPDEIKFDENREFTKLYEMNLYWTEQRKQSGRN